MCEVKGGDAVQWRTPDRIGGQGVDTPCRGLRTLAWVLFLVVVLLGAGAWAQELRDDRHRRLAWVDESGWVRDASHARMIRIQADGVIRDARNRRLGLVASDGTVRNAKNQLLGRIHDDGTVRDARNRRLGTVDTRGCVRNARNQVMGRVKGVTRTQAAIFFFFWESLTGA